MVDCVQGLNLSMTEHVLDRVPLTSDKGFQTGSWRCQLFCTLTSTRMLTHTPIFLLFQILEVNGQNFENVPLSKATEILKNNTHLSITVKTNLLGTFLGMTYVLIVGYPA